jgi:hypothetical protein
MQGLATKRNGRQRTAGATTRARRVRFDLLRCWEAVLKREVDEAAGVIRGVKIVGTKSRNGRRYTVEALRRAIPMYEGSAVNVDHPHDDPDETRSSYDRFGLIRNVRPGDDGLYGDLHYLTSHRMAASVVEDAKKGLGLFGLSHNASGDGYMENDGTRVIDRILEVRHVDLVADPATTNSLFESLRPRNSKRRRRMAGVTDPKKLSVSGSALEDMDTNPLLGDVAAVEDEEPGWDDQLGELVKSIMCDPDLDPKAKREKILSALKLMDEDESDAGDGEDAEESEDDEEEDDDKDGDYEESISSKSIAALAKHKDPAVRKLVEAFDASQTKTKLAAKRELAAELCRRAKLPKEARSAIFMESLYAAPSKKHMVKLIKDRRALLEAKQPRSHGGGGGAPELDLAGFTRKVKEFK